MRKLIPFSSTTKTESSHYKIEETEEKIQKSPEKDMQRQNSSAQQLGRKIPLFTKELNQSSEKNS